MAEATGRALVTRLYEFTEDPGMVSFKDRKNSGR